VTLFVKEELEFKSMILRDRVKQIVNTLYGYPLMKSKHFILHKTKKQTV